MRFSRSSKYNIYLLNTLLKVKNKVYRKDSARVTLGTDPRKNGQE